ncbi:hypothetical protein OAP14_05730 [Aliiglaciecola sp.]|nr:hypothetical protein [Aliiglaciecola sp.]
MNKLSLTNFPVTLYIFADEGLLYHHVSTELNTVSGTTIWLILSLDEDNDVNSLSLAFSRRTGKSLSEASRDVARVHACLSDHTLGKTYRDSQYPELNQAPKTSTSNSFCISVAETNFSITTPNIEMLTDLKELLKPIVIGDSPASFSFQIVFNKPGCDLIVNNELVESVENYNHLIPVVIDRIQVLAYQVQKYSFCFHGAALQAEQGLLLLPGSSGAGKSTLAALMSAQGVPLYSDEMIAFDSCFNVIPITLPIALKSGSWTLMQPYFPMLEKAAIWERIDGRKLKYVWPQKFASKSTSRTARMIVNPNYHQNTGLDGKPFDSTCKLSLVETLSMFTQSGYQAGVETNRETIEKLLHYVENSNRFSLHYGVQHQPDKIIKALW